MNETHPSSVPTVVSVDLLTAPATPSRPQVVWAAPGSICVDAVDAAWGRRCDPVDLGGVTGPWGVVLWDPRSSSYLLAVDPVGVQPLYWARPSADRMVVSSWLDRLLDTPGVGDEPDDDAILWDHRVGVRVESFLHRTHFAAVQRVPWGRVLRVPVDAPSRLERYWDPADLPGPDPSIDLPEAALLLRERIDAAIVRLLPDDASVLVGGHVSGGLDCTSVACRAAHHLSTNGRSLRSGYSWSPSEDDCARVDGDERALLDLVSDRYGFPVRRVAPPDGADWYDELDPHRYPPNTIRAERRILPIAASDGISVMFSGWGGDELSSFNGRMVIDQLVRSGRFRTVDHILTARAELRTTSPIGTGRRLRQFVGALLHAAPAPVRTIRHPLRAFAERRHQRAVDALLAASSPVVADLERERRRMQADLADHHGLQLMLLTNGHLQHRIDCWYQIGRRFGIDYRYPLLDLGVVTAALSLPWSAYLSEGWNRVAFRTAVDPWVPAEVAWNLAKSEPSRFGGADAVNRGAPASGMTGMGARLRALPQPHRRRIVHGPVRHRADAAPFDMIVRFPDDGPGGRRTALVVDDPRDLLATRIADGRTTVEAALEELSDWSAHTIRWLDLAGRVSVRRTSDGHWREVLDAASVRAVEADHGAVMERVGLALTVPEEDRRATAEARRSRRRQDQTDWSTVPSYLGLRVVTGPVPAELPGAERPFPWIQVTPNAARVQFADGNAMLVADGRDVTVDWTLADDERDVHGGVDGDVDLGWIVQGWAVSLASMQRGAVSLHASTVRLRSGQVVAIAGRQGAGKSTTAMALRARGHSLLVDDTTVLEFRDGGAWTTPYSRNVHLLSDAAAAVGVDFDALPVLAGRVGKSSFRPEEPPVDPVRLDRIVVLDRVRGAGVVRRRDTRGAVRVEVLRRHLDRRGLAPMILGQEAFFASLAQLASSVDVEVIERPVDDWTLDAVVELVERPPT